MLLTMAFNISVQATLSIAFDLLKSVGGYGVATAVDNNENG